jgi:hypothetical protein
MNEALAKLKQMQKDKLKEMAKDHQDQQDQNNFGPNVDYEEIVYSPLEFDKKKRLKFYRMLGWPIHLRHEDPKYSPKVVMISRIRDDRGRLRRFILPTREEDNNYILYKLMDKVLEGEFDKETESKRYFHTKEKIFEAVFKNNRDNNYERGWRPSQYVIMNVIDREMYKWHQENKHSVLVSKKATSNKDDESIVYYEPGTTMAMYTATMDDDVAGAYGYPINYDIVVKKLSDQPWYKVYHAKEFEKYANKYSSEEEFKKDYPFYDPSVHTRPLTEEEMSWERYDIEKLFKVSSYQKIYNSLKGFFQLFDKTFNMDLTEELKELVEEEKKKYKEEKESEESSSSVTVEKVEPKKEEPEEKEVDLPTSEEEPKPRRRSTGFDLSSLAEKGFTAIDKLTEEEKAVISGYDEEKGTLTYSTSEQLFACINEPECTNVTPESFHLCPKCGETF